MSMTTLGERLKHSRLQAKLSQVELAVRAGVSQGLVHKIESGKALESRKLSRMAAALGVSTDWLSIGCDDLFESTEWKLDLSDGQEIMRRRMDADLILAFERLSPENKKLVESLVHALNKGSA